MMEAMETARGPAEEALYRIDRLEQEVTALKLDDRASLAAIADIADVGRAQSRSAIYRNTTKAGVSRTSGCAAGPSQ